MSIPATETVTSGLFGPTAGAGSTSTSTDKEMFLKLLVAQLRYQDPMNPADSGEFLAQSAQFTALEKMDDVAAGTAMLLGAQMAFGASSMVGRTVTYTLADGTEGQGVVRGVTFDASGPVLDVDGTDVPLVQVQSVVASTESDPGTAPDPTSTPTAP